MAMDTDGNEMFQLWWVPSDYANNNRSSQK